ncbi:hypothetical protein SD81_007130 [Tolypothrix campylonemoides VB511288]|nr:hypothetical protein SD81_007130 [Tolypothrix campylonemoides VB511288]
MFEEILQAMANDFCLKLVIQIILNQPKFLLIALGGLTNLLCSCADENENANEKAPEESIFISQSLD